MKLRTFKILLTHHLTGFAFFVGGSKTRRGVVDSSCAFVPLLGPEIMAYTPRNKALIKAY